MTDSSPQFGTAEYKVAPGTDVCKSCKQAITGTYYRVNGTLACERCVAQLKGQIPKDSHSAFVRGLVFGIGGAVIGLILYSAFSIITGLVIGYVSLAVGWIIAKAMKMGSAGTGGRRYQVAAAVLTYAAVSMAAIPIYISQLSKQVSPTVQQTQTTSPDRSTATELGQNPPDAATAPSSQRDSSEKPKPNLASVVGLLVLLGLASPFLELQSPAHGAIGLVILFVGINIAWRMTAGPKLDILGPFAAGASKGPAATT
jgi:hypothetical protein